LKLKEWSPVVELEESFDLYQLIAAEHNPDPDRVVYIFFKITAPRDIGWEVPDVAQLKRNIAQSRRTEKQAPWVRELVKKFGVAYPNGVQLFAPPKAALAKPAAKPVKESKPHGR
jgi:hypothetical protein